MKRCNLLFWKATTNRWHQSTNRRRERQQKQVFFISKKATINWYMQPTGSNKGSKASGSIKPCNLLFLKAIINRWHQPTNGRRERRQKQVFFSKKATINRFTQPTVGNKGSKSKW